MNGTSTKTSAKRESLKDVVEFCPSCGAEIRDSSEGCPSCGYPGFDWDEVEEQEEDGGL